jgi:hypothetical protein
MESTSVMDFIFDAIFTTHPGTSDEALGLVLSRGEFIVDRHNVSKNEINKHLLALGNALYQLCIDCARLFVLGGKTLFDALHKMVNPVQQNIQPQQPVRRRQR